MKPRSINLCCSTAIRTVTIIGIDLAKHIFHLNGADRDGSVLFRKRLSRSQLVGFVSQVPRCVVAMEAGATAHGWGRAFEKLGHEERLIPPVYVKPFVKRQKNDSADAEAIVAASRRPSIRFVALKMEGRRPDGALRSAGSQPHRHHPLPPPRSLLQEAQGLVGHAMEAAE